MDGGAENAGLLDLWHRLERAHRCHGVGRANLEDWTRLEQAFELVHRTMRRQSSRLNDGYALTVLRLVQIVGRHEHRDAAGRERFNQPPESPARERIDTTCRFIE